MRLLIFEGIGMSFKMADHFKTAQPVEYLRKFLEKEVRPDGRELGEFRHTIINVGSIGTAEGSALVKVGHTTVICGVKAELAVPSVSDPDKGFLVPNVEMTPMCSPCIKPGAPSTVAQVASQFILNVINSCKCLMREELCIAKHKLCWVLHCDMLCLDWDGNLLDACLLSIIAALRNTQLPLVSWDEESQTTVTDPHVKRPLNVHCTPVATSFAIFDHEVLLVDPTHDEEQVSTGLITITTVAKEICSFHKPGGSPVSDEQIKTLLERSQAREYEVQQLLDTALQAAET